MIAKGIRKLLHNSLGTVYEEFMGLVEIVRALHYNFMIPLKASRIVGGALQALCVEAKGSGSMVFEVWPQYWSWS